ncbi:hypothetical protein Bca4012_099157 [Brassica carinata]
MAIFGSRNAKRTNNLHRGVSEDSHLIKMREFVIKLFRIHLFVVLFDDKPVVKHNKLEPKHGETMPELLSEFITLLGKEKEEWGGVKAMTECVEEYRRWKNEFQELNDKDATCNDFPPS